MKSLRMTEEQWREDCAKRSRFQRGSEVVNTSTPGATVAPPFDGAASPAAAPGTPKYRNTPTDGYASKREAKRAMQLRLMQEAGQIRNLREQVSYLLIPAYRDATGKTLECACSYVADFVYDEFPMWHPVVEDCKGLRTAAYIIKRKLMLMVHGVKVRET